MDNSKANKNNRSRPLGHPSRLLKQSSDESSEKLNVSTSANNPKGTPKKRIRKRKKTSSNNEEKCNTNKVLEISTETNTSKDISKDCALNSSSEKICPQGTSSEVDQLNIKQDSKTDSLLPDLESTSQDTSLKKEKLNTDKSNRSNSPIILYEQYTVHDSPSKEKKLNTNQVSEDKASLDCLKETVLQDISSKEDELKTNQSNKNRSSLSDITLDYVLEDTLLKDNKLNRRKSNSLSIIFEEFTIDDTSSKDNKLKTNQKSRNISPVLCSEKFTSQDKSYEKDELNTDQRSESNSPFEVITESTSQDKSYEEDEFNTDQRSESNSPFEAITESTSQDKSYEKDEFNTDQRSESNTPIEGSIESTSQDTSSKDDKVNTSQKNESIKQISDFLECVLQVASFKIESNAIFNSIQNSLILGSTDSASEDKSAKEDELNSSKNITTNSSDLSPKESTTEDISSKENELNSSKNITTNSSDLSPKESATEDISSKEDKLNTNERNISSSLSSSFEESLSYDRSAKEDELNSSKNITTDSSDLSSEEFALNDTSSKEDELNSSKNSSTNSSDLSSEKSASEDISSKENELNSSKNNSTNSSDLSSEKSASEDISSKENELNTNKSKISSLSSSSFKKSSPLRTSSKIVDTKESDATSSSSTVVSNESIKQKVSSYLKSINSLKQNIVGEYTESISELQIENLNSLYKEENLHYTSMSTFSITTMGGEIISKIDNNRLVFIKGPTGCGKSTQVPLLIYDSCLKQNIHCNIIVTQPSQIAAISIAKRICYERDWSIGINVGYHTDFFKYINKNTFITYCTNYVLLNKFVERNVNRYTHIILDDVHERSKELDILLHFIKTYLTNNSSIGKIILMSATFNLKKFVNYFVQDNKDISSSIIDFSKEYSIHRNISYLHELFMLGSLPKVSKDVTVITKRMMNYCVKLIKTIEDFQLKASGKAKTLNRKSGFLIFLPKIQEIKQMYDKLMSDKYKKYQWEVIIFDSSINIFKQEKLLNPQLLNKNRRIILATNIAENGIKIPDVEYIIDFCLTVQLKIDQKSKIPQLRNVWASKIICEQRSNRINCEEEGYTYRLIPKYFYEKILPKEPNPEIMECPLEDIYVKMKIFHLDESDHIFSSLLDPPPPENVKLSRLLLQEYGALRNTDKNNINITQLTKLGYLISALPLEIHLTKLILLGYFFSLLEDMIIIACCMSVKDIYFNLNDKKNGLKIYSEKLKWADNSGSDCIVLLNIYKEWIKIQTMSKDFQEKWTENNFLQIDALHEVSFKINCINDKLLNFGIFQMWSNNSVKWDDEVEKELIIKIVIAGAFYPYYYNKCTNLENPVCKDCLTKDFNEMDTVVLENLSIKEPERFYTRQIENIFKRNFISSIKKINPYSLYSQVHIQFDIEENRDIPLTVYKSVQMRKLKIPFEICYLNEKYAKFFFKNSIIDDRTNLYNERTYLLEDECAYMNPILPSITAVIFPIKVTYFISPYHFWVHIFNSQTEKKMVMIHQTLNNELDSVTTFNILPKINDLVAVSLNLYGANGSMTSYRAIVKEYKKILDETYATVQLIDIGYTASVNSIIMRKILKDYMYRIPALAIECVLAEIEDNPEKDNQYESFLNFLKELYMNTYSDHKLLYGQIYSIVNNVISLTLICRTTYTIFNINAELKNRRYAIEKEESQLSKENNYVRNNWLNMSRAAIESYNKMQYREKYSNDFCNFTKSNLHVENFNCVSRITLRGPYSLLECNFSALTKATKLQKIIIDCNSINSVVLDNDTKDTNKKNIFLVAGKIMHNTNDNTLILYNTTVIEDTCGLEELIVLIFSSHLELRRDLFGMYYIGALCGLGFDNYTGFNIFPEHEMEIQFNFKISLADIKHINELRKYMNQMLYYSKDMNDEEIRKITYQRLIKDLILELLKINRKHNKNLLLPNSYKWGLYEESEIIKQDDEFNTSFENNIYETHSIVTLYD
ncbi:hypothetical protein M0804_004791 [Polistes exclamans]|nr:hypothetical protein M0804_004791 [Polistes exclamans]